MESEPPFEPDSLFFWKAFSQLHSERQVGMSVGFIPFTSMIAYAHHYGLEQDETDEFIEIITEVDAAYVGIQSKRAAGKRNQSSPG